MSYQQHILLSEYSNSCAPVYQSESCCNRSKRWCCSCLCPTCMTARNLYLLGHRFWFLAIILAWLPCFASYYRGFIYKELKVPSQGGLANCLLHSCCFCKTCTIVQESRSSIVHSNNGRPRLNSVESVLIAQQSYENQKQQQQQQQEQQTSSSQTQQSKQYNYHHTNEIPHLYDVETGSLISNSNPQYFNNVDNHHTTPLIYEDGQIFIQNIPPQHPTKGNNYRRSSMQYHDNTNDNHHQIQELSPTHKQRQYHQHYHQQHQHQPQYQGMNGYPQFHGQYHINLNAPLVMDRPMPPQSAPVIRSITTAANIHQQQIGFNSKGNKVTDKSTLFGSNSTQSYPTYDSLHDCSNEQSFTPSTQQHQQFQQLQHNSQHEVILATEPRGMPHYVPMYQPHKIATSEENDCSPQLSQQHQQQHHHQQQHQQQNNDLLQHYYPARCPGRHVSIHPERGVVTPQQSETMIIFSTHQSQFTSPQMVIEENETNLYQTPETNSRQLGPIQINNNNDGRQHPNENQQLTNKPSISKLTPFQKKHMYSSDIRHQMEQLSQPTLQEQHDEQDQFHSNTEQQQQQQQQHPPQQHQQPSQQRSIPIIPCDEDDEKNTINPLTGEDHIVSLSRAPSVLSNSHQSISCIANRSNCSKLSTNNSYITTCSTNQSSNSKANNNNNNKKEKVFFQTKLPHDLIEDSNGTEPKLLTECKPISYIDADIDPHFHPTARLSFASAYLPTLSLEYSPNDSIDCYSGNLDQIDSSSNISNPKHQNNRAISRHHNKQQDLSNNMNQRDISTQQHHYQQQQKSHHHTRSSTADSNYNVNSTRVTKLYVDTSRNNHEGSKCDEIHVNSPISPINDDIEEDHQRISIAFDQLHNQINQNDFIDDQQLMYHIMSRGLHDKPKRTSKNNPTTKNHENDISTTNTQPISSNHNQPEDKVVEHDDLYEDDGYYVDFYNSDTTSTSLFSHHRSTPNSTVVKSLERSTSNVKSSHPSILSPSQYQLQIDRQATSIIDNNNIPNSSKLYQRKLQQQQQQPNSYTPLQTDYFSSTGNDNIIPDIFELNQFNSAVQHFLEQQFENNENGDNAKEQPNQSGLITPVSKSRTMNENGTNNQAFQFEDGFGSLYTPKQYQQDQQSQPTRTFCLSQYQQENSISNNQSTTISTLLLTPTIPPNSNVHDQVDLLSSSESSQPSISAPLTSIQEIDSFGDESHLSNIPPRDDTEIRPDTNDINNDIVIKSPPPSTHIPTTKLSQPNMKLNISTVSLSPYCFPVRATNTRPSARQTESTPIEYHITSSDDDLPIVSSTMSTTEHTSTNDYNTIPIQSSTTAIESTNKQQSTIVSTDEIAYRRIISIESETEQNEPTIIEKYATDKDIV